MILVVPPDNPAEAVWAMHANVRVVWTLLACCAGPGNPRLLPPMERVDTTRLPLPDLAEVRGSARVGTCVPRVGGVGLRRPSPVHMIAVYLCCESSG